MTFWRVFCHANSLWEGRSCLIVCLIIPCWALLTSQSQTWRGEKSQKPWWKHSTPYSGLWFHFELVSNEETLKISPLYFLLKVLECLLTCNNQTTQKIVCDEIAGQLNVKPVELLMRGCKLHYKGVNASWKHSEIIVLIKRCVNGNVSHWSVLPPNQLNVLEPRFHKITFPHTNQVFLH